MEATTTAQVAVMTHDQLAAAYLELIGYNPFEDSPTITDEEVRQTLTEWLIEAAKPAKARTYLTEFPDFGALPAGIAALLADGTLADLSWHKDACPSFCHADDAHQQIDDMRTLWVNFENPEDREFRGASRFSIQYPSGKCLSFDTEQEAIAAMLAAK